MNHATHAVSVVIPTHDRQEQVSRLIASIGEPGAVEVVVVDDGSNPPIALSERGLKVVRNDRPRLLAAARNMGAANSSGEVLVFVDDDCVIARDALTPLVDALSSDPSVGIVGPVIAYLSSPDTIWCAGSQHGKWTGLARLRGQGAPLQAAKTLPPECDDFPCAFAMRREVFDEVGGFDEDLQFHMTEGDIAERVRARGYRVALSANALVWHDFAFPPEASFSRRLMSPRDADRAFLVARDRVRFITRQRISRVRRASQLAFYLFVLVPAYATAILMDRERPLHQRLQTTASFLAGNWTGLVKNARSLRQ
jgi:GT2 family glycosyltransferase